MRYKTLACDYDLTLAAGDHLEPETIAALRRWKESGRKLILVTGRTGLDVYGPRGLTERSVLSLFDRVVTENGAVIWSPKTDHRRLIGNLPSPIFVKNLIDAGVKNLTVGFASVHVPTRYRDIAARVVRRGRFPVQPIVGTHHDVYVDYGIDKTSGLKVALAEMGLRADQTVTVGDGHNDTVMLDYKKAGFGLGVAMGNGVDENKAVAGMVTKGGPGTGVVELIDFILATDVRKKTPSVPAREIAA